MTNPSGSLTINGLTDAELSHLFEIKSKHQQHVNFNPANINTVATSSGQSYYNNVVFTWNGEQGLEIVHDLLRFLLKKEEQAKASGQ